MFQLLGANTVVQRYANIICQITRPVEGREDTVNQTSDHSIQSMLVLVLFALT